MIDAKDLMFGKYLVNLLIELFGRTQVIAERFFDDNPRPRFLICFGPLGQTTFGKPFDDWFIKTGSRGQVENIVALGSVFGGQFFEPILEAVKAIGLGRIGREIMKTLGESLPRFLFEIEI